MWFSNDLSNSHWCFSKENILIGLMKNRYTKIRENYLCSLFLLSFILNISFNVCYFVDILSIRNKLKRDTAPGLFFLHRRKHFVQFWYTVFHIIVFSNHCFQKYLLCFYNLPLCYFLYVPVLLLFTYNCQILKKISKSSSIFTIPFIFVLTAKYINH